VVNLMTTGGANTSRNDFTNRRKSIAANEMAGSRPGLARRLHLLHLRQTGPEQIEETEAA